MRFAHILLKLHMKRMLLRMSPPPLSVKNVLGLRKYLEQEAMKGLSESGKSEWKDIEAGIWGETISENDDTIHPDHNCSIDHAVRNAVVCNPALENMGTASRY